MQIEAIYTSPIKSLALRAVERVQVGAEGIAGDRRFFLIDANDRVFTQRELGALVQVRAEYEASPEALRVEFPNGDTVEGKIARGAKFDANLFGRACASELVDGPWAKAFSDFTGQPVRLARATGMAFDTLPVSICSSASVEEVRRRADGVAVDERRFRPNFYISGVGAHGEDEWVGRRVRIGSHAVVHVRMRDERCVMTTHSPDTGDIDMNTLKIIAGYRTDQPKQVNFGVYGTVEREGDVTVGDTITPLDKEAR